MFKINLFSLLYFVLRGKLKLKYFWLGHIYVYILSNLTPHSPGQSSQPILPLFCSAGKERKEGSRNTKHIEKRTRDGRPLIYERNRTSLFQTGGKSGWVKSAKKEEAPPIPPPSVKRGGRNLIDNSDAFSNSATPSKKYSVHLLQFYGYTGWYLNQSLFGGERIFVELFRHFLVKVPTKFDWQTTQNSGTYTCLKRWNVFG